jgi:hypothetical protein
VRSFHSSLQHHQSGPLGWDGIITTVECPPRSHKRGDRLASHAPSPVGKSAAAEYVYAIISAKMVYSARGALTSLARRKVGRRALIPICRSRAFRECDHCSLTIQYPKTQRRPSSGTPTHGMLLANCDHACTCYLLAVDSHRYHLSPLQPFVFFYCRTEWPRIWVLLCSRARAGAANRYE